MNGLGESVLPSKQAATPLRTLQQAATFLCQYVKICVISRGPEGSFIRSQGGEEALGTTGTVRVHDTVGAGDAFTAGALWALLARRDLASVASIGCRVGTLAVQTDGAEIDRARLEELRSHIANATADAGSPAWNALTK